MAPGEDGQRQVRQRNRRGPRQAAAAARGAGGGAVGGAAGGAALWGLAAPLANVIGFGANGIAAGSTAASMMSSAAIANGGGVAAGSTVAVLQSIGAVGLAVPVGLGIVGAGAVVGGVIFGLKAYFSKAKPTWFLLVQTSETRAPVLIRFKTEAEAQEMFTKSSAAEKMVFSAVVTPARGDVLNMKGGTSNSDLDRPSWFLFEWTPGSRAPVLTRFANSCHAWVMHGKSSATNKKIFSAYYMA